MSRSPAIKKIGTGRPQSSNRTRDVCSFVCGNGPLKPQLGAATNAAFGRRSSELSLSDVHPPNEIPQIPIRSRSISGAIVESTPAKTESRTNIASAGRFTTVSSSLALRRIRQRFSQRVADVVRCHHDVAMARQVRSQQSRVAPVARSAVGVHDQRIAPGRRLRVTNGALQAFGHTRTDREAIASGVVLILPAIDSRCGIPELDGNWSTFAPCIAQLDRANAYRSFAACERIVRHVYLPLALAVQGITIGCFGDLSST